MRCSFFNLVEVTGLEPTTSWSLTVNRLPKTLKNKQKRGIFAQKTAFRTGFSFRYPNHYPQKLLVKCDP
mgnify:CR=1 FL=1